MRERHPVTGRFLAHDCEVDCLVACTRWYGVAICEQGGRNDPYFGYFSFMDGSQGGRTWEEQVAAGNALLERAGREVGPWAASVRRGRVRSEPRRMSEVEELRARLAEVEQALRSALNVIDTTHALAYGRDALVAPHDGRSLADHTDDGGVYCWACEFTLEARAVLDKGEPE